MASVQRVSTPRGGQRQAQSSAPSTTITTTTAQPQVVLHLRGASHGRQETDAGESSGDGNTRRRIQWAEDVIDNEGLGRKTSKVCCIYHAPKGIDESSDESSSDSDDSDSDSGDDGAARPPGRRREGDARGHGQNHDHDHEHDHDHSHGKGTAKGKGKGRARSPNAYEKMPKPKNAHGKDKI